MQGRLARAGPCLSAASLLCLLALASAQTDVSKATAAF